MPKKNEKTTSKERRQPLNTNTLAQRGSVSARNSNHYKRKGHKKKRRK